MPYTRKSKRNPVFQGKSFLIFVLAAWAFYLSSYQVFLRIDNSDTHTPLFWAAVKANDSFVLVYRRAHATYLEYYRILRGRLFVLTGISFKSQNGLPPPSLERGTFKSLGNGWKTIQNLHKGLKTIPFVMGASGKTAQTLIIRDKKYPLHGIAPPGTPVVLKVLRARKYDQILWRIRRWLE